MATFILVHGAWHGAWCWHRIVARLQSQGHVVLAPDLHGLGRDFTPLGEVTLAGWTGQITQLIDDSPGPVILVGHSRGGLIISEAAEKRPDRIHSLVYLTAFLLRSGEQLHGSVAATDPNSLVGPHMIVASDHLSASVADASVKEAFYGECSAEDVVLAKSLLRPEPLAPLVTPLHLTDERFGSVPRIFIECLRDRAITLPSQRAMQEALPCKQTFHLDTDHSPFFSRPDELANVLENIAH